MTGFEPQTSGVRSDPLPIEPQSRPKGFTTFDHYCLFGNVKSHAKCSNPSLEFDRNMGSNSPISN